MRYIRIYIILLLLCGHPVVSTTTNKTTTTNETNRQTKIQGQQSSHSSEVILSFRLILFTMYENQSIMPRLSSIRLKKVLFWTQSKIMFKKIILKLGIKTLF